MKTISKIMTLMFAIPLIAGINIFAQEYNHSHNDSVKGNQKIVDAVEFDKNNDGSVFQCSMNPDQISDEPGNCSKCRMKLTQVSIEDANSNLESKGMMNDGMNKMEMKDDHMHMQDNKAMMDSCKHCNKTEMKEKCKKMMMDMKEGQMPDSCKQMMKKHKGMMEHDKMNHSKKEASIVREGDIDVDAIDENKDGKVFQDMMDWNVISDKAGKCPKCGMTLKEVSIDKAKQNLIDHGYKTK